MAVFSPGRHINVLRNVTVEIDTQISYKHANIYFSSAFPPGMDLVEYKDYSPFFIRHETISRIFSPVFKMEESTGKKNALRRQYLNSGPRSEDFAMYLDDPEKYEENDPDLDYVLF